MGKLSLFKFIFRFQNRFDNKLFILLTFVNNRKIVAVPLLVNNMYIKNSIFFFTIGEPKQLVGKFERVY